MPRTRTETRVVVLRGNRVEEFDFESANRKQLRGNIYLAKVTRVEPSLQAAFVDYGGTGDGFLAFSEIHPDYYQIPVADRQALLEQRRARPARRRRRCRQPRQPARTRPSPPSRRRPPPWPATCGAASRFPPRINPTKILPLQILPLQILPPKTLRTKPPERLAGAQTPEQIADTAAVMAATTPAAEHEAEELVRKAAGLPADEAVAEAAPQLGRRRGAAVQRSSAKRRGAGNFKLAGSRRRPWRNRRSPARLRRGRAA